MRQTAAPPIKTHLQACGPDQQRPSKCSSHLKVGGTDLQHQGTHNQAAAEAPQPVASGAGKQLQDQWLSMCMQSAQPSHQCCLHTDRLPLPNCPFTLLPSASSTLQTKLAQRARLASSHRGSTCDGCVVGVSQVLGGTCSSPAPLRACSGAVRAQVQHQHANHRRPRCTDSLRTCYSQCALTRKKRKK